MGYRRASDCHTEQLQLSWTVLNKMEEAHSHTVDLHFYSRIISAESKWQPNAKGSVLQVARNPSLQLRAMFQTCLSVPGSLPQTIHNVDVSADTGFHHNKLQKQMFMGYTLVHVTISCDAPKPTQVFKPNVFLTCMS